MAVNGVEYPRVCGDAVPLPNGRMLILNGMQVGGGEEEEWTRMMGGETGGKCIASSTLPLLPLPCPPPLCPTLRSPPPPNCTPRT